jgi:hypothetical protein
MAFRINLWQVTDNRLEEMQLAPLENEQMLEDWITGNPSILGLDMFLIGRQVITGFGGRIDLLGIDRDGDLIIFELKRDKTPRDIIAQTLDYASWVTDLDYDDIDSITKRFLDKDLYTAYAEHFGDDPPEEVNLSHQMVIVASELDEASERIIQYLSSTHGVNINGIFFNYFKKDGATILGRAWLMDPGTVEERAESRKKAPWSGYYYVNVTEGDHRDWDDNSKYGFISAGTDRKYSDPLKKLNPGDRFFAYMRGKGYVGYGEVTRPAVMIKDFVPDNASKSVVELGLKAPKANLYKDNPDMSEWAVGVKWFKTFPRDNAKTFKGVFANQNIVCKLRHPETVEFLKKEFDVGE